MTKRVSQPPTKWNFFGSPPLLDVEDPAAYDDMLACVSGAVKPSDILEEIWVRDVVDLSWEVLRLRRLKADLIATTAHKGLEAILEPFCEWPPGPGQLCQKWASRDSSAIEIVNKLLASAELTMEDVMAQTLALKLDEIERIDRMTMNAEARRNATLREIYRHRASVAQALRLAVNNIEDAHFEEIGAKQITDREAA